MGAFDEFGLIRLVLDKVLIGLSNFIVFSFFSALRHVVVSESLIFEHFLNVFSRGSPLEVSLLFLLFRVLLSVMGSSIGSGSNVVPRIGFGTCSPAGELSSGVSWYLL